MLLGVLSGLFFQSSFFDLFDLQADHAKKHALEVSILRSWAILHVTSFLALLASLVAPSSDYSIVGHSRVSSKVVAVQDEERDVYQEGDKVVAHHHVPVFVCV